MDAGTWVVVVVTVLLVCVIPLGYFSEKRHWNEGVCPECGGFFRYFDIDSQGGRGYKCPDCGSVTWVSWFRPKERTDDGAVAD